jgi:hypothetical protein
MGKLKIEELEDLTLFKKWFEKIGKEAHEKMDKEALRKWASAEKNTAIKEKFKNELKRLNPHPKNKDGYEYEIRPNNDKNVRKYHKGGWLYDFCLRELKIKTKTSKEIITLKKMILAMEVEMTQNDGSIRNDFHKLLQADAEYKIMVFQRRKKDDGDVSDTIEMLKKQVEAYKPKSNSKYLLCGWSITRFKFEFYAFIVESGKINEIQIG